MTETASRQRVIVIRVLRVLPGLAFLTIGTAKLTGSLHTVETFTAFGWGQWFRYLTGLLDVAGAQLLFVPKWTFYGALLLACTVGLGTVLTLTRLHDNLAPPPALTLMAATLAWLTRPRKAMTQGTHSSTPERTRAAV